MENSKRYLSVEIFKALGILSVIIAQPIVGMFVLNDQGGLRFQQAEGLLRGLFHCGIHFFPFMLPALAGSTFFTFLKNKDMHLPQLARRALILCLLGFLMNLLAWGAEDAFDWDVLQFVALSMLICYPFIKKIAHPYGLLILGSLAVLALALSESFPLPGFRHLYIYAVVLGDAWGENYWPLCPWFSTFFLGVFLGHLFYQQSPKIKILPWAGAFLFLLSLFSGRLFTVCNVENIWGPAIFKPSIFFMSGILGFYLMVIPGLHLSLGRYPRLKSILQHSPLVYYARGILWIYILTVVIGFNLTRFVFSSRTVGFCRALSVLALLIIFNLLLGYIIGRLISRRKEFIY